MTTLVHELNDAELALLRTQHRRWQVRVWIAYGIVSTGLIATAIGMVMAYEDGGAAAAGGVAVFGLVFCLTILGVRLMTWTRIAEDDFKKIAFKLGEKRLVKVVEFSQKSSDESGERVRLKVVDMSSRRVTVIPNTLVPNVHAKCLRPRATLVMKRHASNPKRVRIDWMATEHTQATAQTAAKQRPVTKSNDFEVVYCAHCGAPLRPESATKSTPCDYCGELNIPVKG